MVCAVGAEMRDYATLIEAVRGTDLRCHIATDHVRIPGRVRLVNDRRVPIGDVVTQTDAQITSGRMSLTELRNLYARSRFVVVPLLPSDSDNGVTVILEAMAMGKPVICSRTRGQVDIVQDGVTGLYVPVGNPAALREAMLSLWNDPQRAQEMGRRARAYVEAHHTLEMFTSRVRSAVEASLRGPPCTRYVVGIEVCPRFGSFRTRCKASGELLTQNWVAAPSGGSTVLPSHSARSWDDDEVGTSRMCVSSICAARSNGGQSAWSDLSRRATMIAKQQRVNSSMTVRSCTEVIPHVAGPLRPQTDTLLFV